MLRGGGAPATGIATQWASEEWGKCFVGIQGQRNVSLGFRDDIRRTPKQYLLFSLLINVVSWMNYLKPRCTVGDFTFWLRRSL